MRKLYLVAIHGQQRQQQHTFWVAQINIPVTAVNISANANLADGAQRTIGVALQYNGHALRIYTEHRSKEIFLTLQVHPGTSSLALDGEVSITAK